MLMTTEFVDRFHHLAVTETLSRYDLSDSTLHPGENAALNALDTGYGYLRIEQERIPVEIAEAALQHTLNEQIAKDPAPDDRGLPADTRLDISPARG